MNIDRYAQFCKEKFLTNIQLQQNSGTDIEFIVGPTATKIRFHKFLLHIIFPHYDFLTHESSRCLPNIKPSAFFYLKDLIYHNKPKLNTSIVLDVLQLSIKYSFIVLENTCYKFIEQISSLNDWWNIIESDKANPENKHLINALLNKSKTFTSNSYTILKDKRILLLSLKWFTQIISNDAFVINEEFLILELCIQYSKTHCGELGPISNQSTNIKCQNEALNKFKNFENKTNEKNPPIQSTNNMMMTSIENKNPFNDCANFTNNRAITNNHIKISQSVSNGFNFKNSNNIDSSRYNPFKDNNCSTQSSFNNSFILSNSSFCVTSSTNNISIENQNINQFHDENIENNPRSQFVTVDTNVTNLNNNNTSTMDSTTDNNFMYAGHSETKTLNLSNLNTDHNQNEIFMHQKDFSQNSIYMISPYSIRAQDDFFMTPPNGWQNSPILSNLQNGNTFFDISENNGLILDNFSNPVSSCTYQNLINRNNSHCLESNNETTPNNISSQNLQNNTSSDSIYIENYETDLNMNITDNHNNHQNQLLNQYSDIEYNVNLSNNFNGKQLSDNCTISSSHHNNSCIQQKIKHHDQTNYDNEYIQNHIDMNQDTNILQESQPHQDNANSLQNTETHGYKHNYNKIINHSQHLNHGTLQHTNNLTNATKIQQNNNDFGYYFSDTNQVFSNLENVFSDHEPSNDVNQKQFENHVLNLNNTHVVHDPIIDQNKFNNIQICSTMVKNFFQKHFLKHIRIALISTDIFWEIIQPAHILPKNQEVQLTIQYVDNLLTNNNILNKLHRRPTNTSILMDYDIKLLKPGDFIVFSLDNQPEQTRRIKEIQWRNIKEFQTIRNYDYYTRSVLEFCKFDDDKELYFEGFSVSNIQQIPLSFPGL